MAAGIALIAPFGLKHTMRMILYYVLPLIIALSKQLILILTCLLHTDKWAVGLGFQAQYISNFSNYNGGYTGIPSIDAFVAATNPTHLTASGWGYGSQWVPYSSQIYAHVSVLAIAP